METQKFVEHVIESREQIEEVLKVDSLREEVEALKKEMEMLAFFKKFFQNDEEKNKSEINELKSKNKQLSQEIKKSKDIFANLQQEQKQQLTENKKLQKEYRTLTQENQTLQHELQKAQETPLNKLETLFSKLSSTTQTGIKNSLHSENPLTLFASGILHVEPIWEYAKHLLQEEKEEDFKTLREIFYILFESYKHVEDLEYQKVSLQEEFDSHQHIRDSKSEPAGNIQAIQLKGFCRDGEVVKKTVVRVA